MNNAELVAELRHKANECPEWWRKQSVFTRSADTIERLERELAVVAAKAPDPAV